MELGRFMKDLFNHKVSAREPAQKIAQRYVNYQRENAKRTLTVSHRRVILMTLREDFQDYLDISVRPVVEKAGWHYVSNPSVEQATDSLVIILDATPKTDARLHDEYDKILRLKKSMGKVHDIMCLIGRREDYKKYPRGTYPNLIFFCHTEGDLQHRDPDLPRSGTDTVVGPCLYNLCDMPEVIAEKMEESS